MRRIPHPKNDMCDVEDPPYLTSHQPLAVESWSDMCNLKDPPYCPLAISSSALKWYVQCGGPTLPYPHWPSGVESWSGMYNVEDPSNPSPQSSAVESWSDMCNVEDLSYPTPISHQQLRVEVTCAMWRTHPTLPPSVISSWELKWHVQYGNPSYIPTISHQQLRVEVMCNVEDPPYPPLAISSSALKWLVQCGGPPNPTPHQSLAAESWSDMCNVEDAPYPTPIGHQQLSIEVTCAMWRTHPILPPISHQQLRVTTPTSHQQLRIEVTCAMWRTHCSLPPSVISRHQVPSLLSYMLWKLTNNLIIYIMLHVPFHNLRHLYKKLFTKCNFTKNGYLEICENWPITIYLNGWCKKKLGLEGIEMVVINGK